MSDKKILFSREKILSLFDKLDEYLRKERIVGELYLVGGAVMCLAFQAREATRDLDGYFVPKQQIRKIAESIAEEEDLPANWLNDAVKGFFGQHPEFNLFLEKKNLKVFLAKPEYLLAMKCLSLRLGPGFQDEEDLRYLLRYLNIETYQDAIQIIQQYYPLKQIPQKTLHALGELLLS